MMVTQEHLTRLRSVPVLGGLTDVSLNFLLEQSHLVSKTAGEYFFHEGDAAQSFYVLVTGIVVIEKQWQSERLELREMKADDCFGEMAIIDLQSRSASVRAQEPCAAIEITRATLHQLFCRELEQYAILMMNMGREVSRRLRIASDRLFEIEQTLADTL